MKISNGKVCNHLQKILELFNKGTIFRNEKTIYICVCETNIILPRIFVNKIEKDKSEDNILVSDVGQVNNIEDNISKAQSLLVGKCRGMVSDRFMNVNY